MKLNQLSIEELVELRTQMVLEKKSTTQINRVIDEKEREYVKLLLEDTSATGGPAGAVSGGEVSSGGVAFGNAAIAGMGNVVAAQPSSLPGATIDSAWSDHGGTVGSGDVSFPFPAGGKNVYQKIAGGMGKDHGPRTGKKSRNKKLSLKQLKDVLGNRQDYTVGSEKPKKVMNFDDFQKKDLSKVKRLKENTSENLDSILKEYAFWNKDSITAEKILKKLDNLKSSDITTGDRNSRFLFTLNGFNISVEHDIEMFGSPFGYYTVKVDDVEIDCSWNQGRKIYNKAKMIYNKDKKEEEEFIKKDARISL